MGNLMVQLELRKQTISQHKILKIIISCLYLYVYAVAVNIVTLKSHGYNKLHGYTTS